MTTQFGLMPANTSLEQKIEILKATGISLIRIPLFIQQVGTHSDWIDELLKAGFQVAVNLDWSNTSTPVAFPTNAELIRQKAEEFFFYYKDYVSQMPFVAVENEWNNINFHKGTIQDYLNELAIVTSVGHKYGFKISDAGISGTGLQYWAYSQIVSVGVKRAWAKKYNVPFGSANYKYLLDAVGLYAKGIKNIPIDYLNVHWYETNTYQDGFAFAAELYQEFCDKTALICNEFGIRGTYSNNLLSETINSVKGIVDYAILYSGNNALSISNQEIINYLK